MRYHFFVVRPKPDNGRIFLTGKEPARVEVGGEVHFEFQMPPHKFTIDQVLDLGISREELPEPGEFVELS
jgi:hypothetical protein